MGGDTESCRCTAMSCRCAANGSTSSQPRWRMQKFEVYREILQKLKDSKNEEASQPGFEDQLCNHFDRLPTSYATDVNVEQPEVVLMHMKLLHRAEDPTTRPAFEVRIVQALVSDLNLKRNVDPQNSGDSTKLKHFFQITISMVDMPKLLSQLTSVLSEIGLNIHEAHAFSTSDGYSLDAFVVDGWSTEIKDVNTAHQRIASRLKIKQTAKALDEARVRVELLEKEYALAVQEDLAIASAATSLQLDPDDSVLKNVLIRISL